MQAKRHVLATDEWMQVKGCESVYAIGDCSSITQRKIMVSHKLLTGFLDLRAYYIYNMVIHSYPHTALTILIWDMKKKLSSLSL